ncbi:TPA: DUF4222 domain-containing protein, partial [Enterobacter hormaechei subsp. xiangfangensis]|nr:DUF4222 domain-containing protein [Enterobacter hormaechei subsp. xiangfangensis]HAV1890662.1 DUF4222 domain-containing protein [Enterobacter hormaechei subsp. xiangfangensis]
MTDSLVPLPGSVWKSRRGNEVKVISVTPDTVTYTGGGYMLENNIPQFRRLYTMIESAPVPTPKGETTYKHPLIDRINALRAMSRSAA